VLRPARVRLWLGRGDRSAENVWASIVPGGEYLGPPTEVAIES
jgi:hypothetical protein